MRQFVLDKEPDSNGMVYLLGKDYKYIRQVLRLTVGDMIKATFKDKTFDMTLCSIDEKKRKLSLQLCTLQNCIFQDQNNVEKDQEQKQAAQNRPEFYLIQFIPKPAKMELIIRQAVESGVNAIIPVCSEFMQKGSENIFLHKTERIERIIKEARQQSGSPVQTKVFRPMKLCEALNLVLQKQNEFLQNQMSTIKICLYEKSIDSSAIHKAVFEQKKNLKIGLCVCVVGSEGGISPLEIEKIKEKGFRLVHFDVNILRCETASLYGMASLQTTVLEEENWQLKE